MSDDSKAAIFDMDGVLIDSYDAHFKSWRNVLADRNIDFSESLFAKTFGKTSKESFHTIWPHSAPPEDELSKIEARKEAEFRDMIQGNFPVMQGAPELIRLLRAGNWSIAIASSGPPENVSLCIEKVGRHLFDAAVTGADVKRGKPDPEVFVHAARLVSVPPNKCVVIEDAPVGIEGARAAGMACVGLASTGRTECELGQADLVIRSLRELTPQTMRHLLCG